jgi:cholesterol transport system auxiliary component
VIRPRPRPSTPLASASLVLATLALATLALTACGSLFQSKARPPTMYMLSAMSLPAAGAPGTQIPADLAVLIPRARTGLDTDRIAALYPDRRLDYFADVRWSGPLDEMVQDLAVQAFHSIGGLRNVSADHSAFSSNYWLELQVTDFQAEYSPDGGAPTVHVRLLARIGNSANRKLLGRFDADIRLPASDNRMSAIIAAFGSAADQALAQIVADAVQTIKPAG